MRATGIIRRVDDLGRVVIPKELRRSLKIKDGAPLEIYTHNGAVCFKPYSPIGEKDWNKAKSILEVMLSCGFALVGSNGEEHCRHTVKFENLDTGIEIAVNGEIVATLLVNSEEALDLLGTEIRSATLVLQKLFADEG
jgi:AbrB family looped-hinge helix DNA binding protein